MATIQKAAIEIKTPEKGTFVEYTEAAAAAFKRGELVTIDSAGDVAALSGTDPALGTIAGLAMHDASGVTATKAIVFLPEPECLFVANLGVSQVTAKTDIRESFGLVEASDLVHVDQSDNSNQRVKVIALDGRDLVGDINGRVVFKFLATALQMTGALS